MLKPTFLLLLGTLIAGLLFASGCIHHPADHRLAANGHVESTVVIHTTPARGRRCVRHQGHWDCHH